MATATETPIEDVPEDEDESSRVESWEFLDRPPTVEQVTEMLSRLRPQWGVNLVDFVDHVQALPSKKKVKKETINDRDKKVTVDEYVDVWTLYMAVAGRIAMLNAAAELNGWRVDLSPDPGSGGVGGFIEMTSEADLRGVDGKAGRIVYREACSIWMTGPNEVCLGSKSGTAWVLAQGGQQAAGTNPFEKVETAARGRAIAAWGIGILPGSGVASVEEMQNRNSIERQQQQHSGRGGRGESASTNERKSRTDLIDEALALAEEIRQLRSEDTPIAERIIAFGVKQAIEQTPPADGEEPVVDWSLWKDGKIILLIGALRQTRTTLLDQRADI